jgi:hypothetical protein
MSKTAPPAPDNSVNRGRPHPISPLSPRDEALEKQGHGQIARQSSTASVKMGRYADKPVDVTGTVSNPRFPQAPTDHSNLSSKP